MDSGPITNRSQLTTMMWTVNSRIAILLPNSGFSNSAGLRKPWYIWRMPTKTPPASSAE